MGDGQQVPVLPHHPVLVALHIAQEPGALEEQPPMSTCVLDVGVLSVGFVLIWAVDNGSDTTLLEVMMGWGERACLV